MKRLFVFISCFVIAMTITGCKPSVERNIDKLEMIVERAELRCDTYSEYDWEKAIYRFGRVIEAINSNKKLTPEQFDEVGRITERMNNVTTKYNVGAVMDDVNNLEEFHEETKDTNNDFEELFEATINDSTIDLNDKPSE